MQSKKIIPLSAILIFLTILLSACGGKNLHFGTYTEFNVAGVETKPTGDVAFKIGYDRAEVAYVPDGKSQEGYSVLGTFDSDVRIFSGYYINEKFATGDAAVIAAGGTPVEDPSAVTSITKPLLLTTGTRLGFNTQFSIAEGGTSAAPFEIMLGYKRANYALVPVDDTRKSVRSTYADIVIGEGSRRARAAAHAGAPETSPGNSIFGDGIIIKQSIATGLAAKALASRGDIKAKLLPTNSLTTSNTLMQGISKEINRIGSSGPAFDSAKEKLAALSGGEAAPDKIKNDKDYLRKADSTLDNKGKASLLNFLKSI